MIVVDASVRAVALGDDGPDGERARRRLGGEDLAGPELVDIEVISAWRRKVAAGSMLPRKAELALADLETIALRRAPHAPLIRRRWELRDNMTVYDASYVALAEVLGIDMMTTDRRLATAQRIRCHVDLVS